MQATINAAYPNRIQLQLGTLTGPLVSTALGPFNPQRDLEVYVNGAVATMVSFRFDAANNQYLMFLGQVFDPASLVQVIHHIPDPPFTAGGAPLPGFALIATLTTGLDMVASNVMVSVPPGIVQHQPVAFTWSAAGAAQIRITTTTGYDSGLLAALSSAGVVYTSGFSSSGTYSATITAYNSSGVEFLAATIPLIVAAAP
jgi:hypothetical protein